MDASWSALPNADDVIDTAMDYIAAGAVPAPTMSDDVAAERKPPSGLTAPLDALDAPIGQTVCANGLVP